MKLVILFIFTVQLAFSKESPVPTKFDMKAYQARIKQAPANDKSGDFTYVGANGNIFHEFAITSGFNQSETQKNGLYIIYREFFPDGVLQREGKLVKLGGANAGVGEWKSYDKNGSLIKVEDYEKGYKIGYEAVLEICQKKNIDLSFRLNSLNRSPPGAAPLWHISWSSGKIGGSINQSPILSGPTTIINNISIDGVTGEIKVLKSSQHLDN